MLSPPHMSPNLTSFWRELSSAGQLSDFWLKCNWQHCFSCRFCLQRWSQLNFLWMSYFSGGFHDYYSLLGPKKNQIQQFGAPVHPDSNVLKGSNSMFCASPHQIKCAVFTKNQVQCSVFLCANSNVLSSQGIKSSIMCFFAPNTDFLSSLCRLNSPNCITVSRFFPKIFKLHHSLLILLIMID